jgi:spermidine synthase
MDLIPGVKILEETTSKVNGKIRVVNSLGLGTYIQVEGLTQSGGIVKEVWKATLKKIRNSKFEIRNCLILGLGGGSAAILVRKYWPKAKITGVDIDPVMVSLGRKYLKLDEAGINLIIKDAEEFLLSISHQPSAINYDLILIDTYLGDEYPKKFESGTFLRLILRLLTDDGVAIFNRLYYSEKRPEAVAFGGKLEKVFRKVEYFYPEANLMFICQ